MFLPLLASGILAFLAAWASLDLSFERQSWRLWVRAFALAFLSGVLLTLAMSQQ